MAVKIFDVGDAPYLAWVAKSPNGFVVNRRKGGLSKNYLVLHAAGCERVTLYNDMSKPGGFTTRGYVKVCSSDLDELHDYVRANCGRDDGSFTGQCAQCAPDSGRGASWKTVFDEANANGDDTEGDHGDSRPCIDVDSSGEPFREAKVEDFLQPWLEGNGYTVAKQVRVASGIIDMIASNRSEEWIIEAKGEDRGGFNTAEMNFRIGVTQLCSRMGVERDVGRKFGLAIPLTKHFRKVLMKQGSFLVFKAMDIWLLVADENGGIRALHPDDVQGYADGLAAEA